MTKPVTAAGVSTSEVNRATYLKHLLTQASAAADESPLPLKALRDEAIAQVSNRTFPSGRDEEWRFTDLSDMLTQPFQRVITAEQQNSRSKSSTETAPNQNTYRLSSNNGKYTPSTSTLVNRPEVIVAPLSKLLNTPEYAQKVESIISEKLARVEGAEEVFTALNTAGFAEVMVVWVAADHTIEAPIYIDRRSQPNQSQEKVLAHLRTLVIAERHAKVTLVETFSDDGSIDSTLNNNADSSSIPHCNTSVTEIWLADGASVNHIRIQNEGSETFHIAKTAVDQAANSQYQCTTIDLGGKLSRHHLEVYQSGPQTSSNLYGLSVLKGKQLADTHSLLTLNHPHSKADQIQKNIVDDKAHAVFNGRVFVSQTAQLTDAAQINRNLMLSSKARIDTKPELDIVADNVKCAHGATVSQLQPNEVFYLQSRGIAAEQAQRLLLYGFAMEIVEKISIASLRQSLSDRLTEWAK